MVTQANEKLTLKDVLAHLSPRDVKKYLGDATERLLRQGGQLEVDPFEQTILDSRRFAIYLSDAVVTITLSKKHYGRLKYTCTKCTDFPCVHIGAAFSTLLEEKASLGLALVPPDEHDIIEKMSEGQLLAFALSERQKRAEKEEMEVRSIEKKEAWTDYIVTSEVSGKTYRVALRGFEAGESYCTCPDYRKNTLGTCKHIIKVQGIVQKKFSQRKLDTPFEQKRIAIGLNYKDRISLHFLLPDTLDSKAERIIGDMRSGEIDEVSDLVHRVRLLEQNDFNVLIYPDAEEFIQQQLFQKHMADLTAEIRKDPAKHPLRTTLLKAELLPYQMDGVAFVAGAGRAVLADDMGLGKTIQGIGVAELLAQQADIKRVLVVCPVSLKGQWRNEIHKFCDRDCQLVMGSGEERAKQYDSDCFFTICNYEQVLRDFTEIEKLKWDLIILDEGQRIKNWEAKTSRVIKALKSRFALVLSGTPLENRLEELYSVVDFIDERRLGPAFRFFHKHREVDDRGKVLGYKNLDELREKLSPILLRRTRALVMKELPPRTTEVVRITPTDEQKELHDGQMTIVTSIVHKPYLTEMDLLRLQKAMLIARMSCNSTFQVNKQLPNFSSKLEKIEEMIEEFTSEGDRKVVAFSEWTTMLDLIEPFLKERKIDYVRLDGSVPQKKRSELVKHFNNDSNCRFFITTNAGSTGLNLQTANTILNIDLPWNPAILEQRIARAHRMGQKNPVQVYLLVSEDTIEERLLGTLAAKQQLANAALDINSDIESVTLKSGMEELKKRLEILLGNKPEAPVDESQKIEREKEAVELAQKRKKVAAAGGNLLSAAFAFMGELMPKQGETEQSRETAELIKKQLSECLTTDEDGTTKLTVTLQDSSALDNLAQAVSALLPQ